MWLAVIFNVRYTARQQHLTPPIEVHYPEVELAEENQDKANRGGNHDTATSSSIDFFISYNGADKTWAEWIAWQLEEERFTTILQAWDFRPGGNFVLKMQEASEKANKTIAVLSTNYLNADFTQPEWAAAFRRDPQGAKGILVPVMVRDCRRELAGLWPQIIYIDLVDLNEQAARQALLKGINLGRNKPITAPVFPGAIKHNEAEGPNFPGGTSSDASAKLSKEKLALPKLRSNRSFNPYKTRDEWIEYITSNLQEAIEGEAPLDFYADDVEGHRQIRILRNQDTIYSLNFKKGGFGSGDAGIVFSHATGRMMFDRGSFNAWGQFTWDAKKESVVLELHDISLLSSFNMGDAKKYTKEEFLAALWNKIRSTIERSDR